MIYVFLVIFLLINSTLGWDAIRLGRWFYFSVFGFTAALLLFALVVPYKIIIDDEGIHSHRFIGRNRTILWRELSHVEMRGQAEADTIWESAIYLFRSFGGETIVANDATTNVEDILRRIRLRHECLEQPYKRQHWYGG
jgi:heme A synthase